jgi:hypothetical protein
MGTPKKSDADTNSEKSFPGSWILTMPAWHHWCGHGSIAGSSKPESGWSFWVLGLWPLNLGFHIIPVLFTSHYDSVWPFAGAYAVQMLWCGPFNLAMSVHSNDQISATNSTARGNPNCAPRKHSGYLRTASFFWPNSSKIRHFQWEMV